MDGATVTLELVSAELGAKRIRSGGWAWDHLHQSLHSDLNIWLREQFEFHVLWQWKTKGQEIG